MSKSIYEEALNLIEHIDRNLPYTWIIGRDTLIKIKQTLEQAQKQKELLEYYIELVETIEILERDYNYGLFKFNGIKYTYNKIKELEKDE